MDIEKEVYEFFIYKMNVVSPSSGRNKRGVGVHIAGQQPCWWVGSKLMRKRRTVNQIDTWLLYLPTPQTHSATIEKPEGKKTVFPLWKPIQHSPRGYDEKRLVISTSLLVIFFFLLFVRFLFFFFFLFFFCACLVALSSPTIISLFLFLF